MKKLIIIVTTMILASGCSNDTNDMKEELTENNETTVIESKSHNVIEIEDFVHVLPTMEEYILNIYPQFDFNWFVDQRDLALLVMNVDDLHSEDKIIAYEYIDNIAKEDLEGTRVQGRLIRQQSFYPSKNRILILINYHDVPLFDNMPKP